MGEKGFWVSISCRWAEGISGTSWTIKLLYHSAYKAKNH